MAKKDERKRVRLPVPGGLAARFEAGRVAVTRKRLVDGKTIRVG